MVLEKITVGPLQTNCYLFGEEKIQELVVIDAELEAWEKMSLLLDKDKVSRQAIKVIIATHAHFDHVRGVAEVREATRASFMASDLAEQPLTRKFGVILDRLLFDGDKLAVGDYKLKVMHTPGHSPGSICLYQEDEGLLFSGDLIFENGVGRTDLPGGDLKQLRKSLRKISALPSSTRVLPGHGEEFVLNDFSTNF